jgi:c-di-GMP-binding flagellar brake protein YcgR
MLKRFFIKKTKAEDSRRFKRLRATFLLRYQVKGQETFRTASLLNISAGGIRFASPTEITPSSSLNLAIQIPSLSKVLEAQARVTRVEKGKKSRIYEVAASFTGLRSEDEKALNQLIEALYENSKTRRFVDHHGVVYRKKG